MSEIDDLYLAEDGLGLAAAATRRLTPGPASRPSSIIQSREIHLGQNLLAAGDLALRVPPLREVNSSRLHASGEHLLNRRYVQLLIAKFVASKFLQRNTGALTQLKQLTIQIYGPALVGDQFPQHIIE